MTFDPLAWGLGFVLTRLSDRLLRACSLDPLRSRLCAEAQEWARELPGDLPRNYEYIFGGVDDDATAESHPARFNLQAALKEADSVPTQAVWFNAFYEHWENRRSRLGPVANSFFQLEPSVARKHLSDLARRMHRCCQRDTSLALPSMAKQLEELVSAQRLERATRIRADLLPEFARRLSTSAQALVLDKPDAWEYRLFSEVLVQELARHSSLRRDYENGLLLGEWASFDDVSNLLNWLQTHMAEAMQFGRQVDVLVNQELQKAFGPPGVQGNAEAIVYVAVRLADIYRRSIEWSISLTRVNTDAEFSEVLRLSSLLVSDIIDQIRLFSAELSNALSTPAPECASENEPRVVALTLTLTVPEHVVAALEQEFDRLTRYFGLD